MKTEKRLSDVTREASTNRVNKFADSLMPSAPKPRSEVAKEEPAQSPEVPPVVAVAETTPAPAVQIEPTPGPVATKPERVRKPSGFTIEDIVNTPAREGDVFNKMVRVTDDHHELLRLLAFKYRKPMNVIVHNLIDLLNQMYQKEQKGGQSDV